jgi:hypothetical protein
MLNKNQLIEILKAEISDREITMTESNGEYDTSEEVSELNLILNCLINETDMNYLQYTWLCDLVESSVECE